MASTIIILYQQSVGFSKVFLFACMQNLSGKSSLDCQSFLGYNVIYGGSRCKSYSIFDVFRGRVVRDLRLVGRFQSMCPTAVENVIVALMTLSFSLSLSLVSIMQLC